ncbi:hypothetical protein CLV24_1475 [Pontibacter ummariensis]|uniref:Uncharacterized protein n=1 Tax=Pontibacter ummariensis TaxID=1610492 RepID=A0A239LK14_9BACT|nr:hypothetical protein [Pontibacter ummariensis]PRY02752.1 hypothetical protein CLV24_1475 [Pontibacter ummariensis]SNT31007.1 hypothetical protein SAMN06296052_14410 [Pontibacter ummariensis]
MKLKHLGLLLIIPLQTACVSVPRETVTLSETLGNDLKGLHASHRNTVQVYYGQLKDDINSFVDDVYAPFVIHYVLKHELAQYRKGEPSLYGAIEAAGQTEGKEEAEEALQVMAEFQEAARAQIESKREELLSPVLQQEADIRKAIDQSYDNAVYANSAITAHLRSIRKVKDAQREALSMAGLGGTDTLVTNTLVRVSKQVKKAVEQGKEIDVQSEDTYRKLEEISNNIKSITGKK